MFQKKYAIPYLEKIMNNTQLLKIGMPQPKIRGIE
jgi:hypothetical protein